MEFLGHTPSACYMSATRRQERVSQLPCTTSLPRISNSYSLNCPLPYPQRTSLTTVGFRPATYYSASQTNARYPLASSQVDPAAPDTGLSELCGLRVPTVYSSARNALYTRYTPRDWMANYQRLLQANDRGQRDAECLIHDSDRLAKELAERTKLIQQESSRKLGDRLSDIVFWQNEMTDEIDKMVKENNDLRRAKRVVEKFMSEVENQQHVAQEALYEREKRQGVDLVHDNVEKALLSEVEAVQRAREYMKKMIDRSNVQLEQNRAAQHEMEVDLKQKFTAQQIDETAVGMKNTSAGVHYYEGVEGIDACASVPETWNAHAQDTVNRSRAERAGSRKLREDIGNGLNQIGQNLSEHWNDVNAALAQRIRETTDARNQLQASLGHTLQEITDTEREIEDIKDAIRAKEGYLKTATSRLNLRLRRPGVENVCDAAQMQLKCEVNQLKDAINQLRNQLCRAQNMLQELLRLRSAKEAEIAVKNNTLFIDRERCLGLRSLWPGGPTAAAAQSAPCPCVPGVVEGLSSTKVCTC